MSTYEYAFTLAPGGASRARTLTIAGVAIAAVCVLSSVVVMRELVAAQPARDLLVPPAVTAATAAPVASAPVASAPVTAAPVASAKGWALAPRWWQGEIKQIVRPAASASAAASVPDGDLTFAKGYQLRLAARGVDQPAQMLAVAPAARTAPAVRKAITVARSETPEIRRVSATRVDPPADPFAGFDAPARPRALAYDEQHGNERGFAEVRRAPPKGLFGTLY
jgi:hypothetical protein